MSGGVGTGGGGLLEVTGVGAPVGAAVQVVSVPLLVQGVTSGARTINNALHDPILMSGGASSATIGAPPQVDVNKAANLTPGRRTHILDGDGPGKGGHGPGRNASGKSEFPTRWTDDEAINHIDDVIKDPNSRWTQQGGVPGATHTKKGDPIRWKVEGTRDGIDIEAIVEPEGEGIITSYPTNVPRNP